MSWKFLMQQTRIERAMKMKFMVRLTRLTQKLMNMTKIGGLGDLDMNLKIWGTSMMTPNLGRASQGGSSIRLKRWSRATMMKAMAKEGLCLNSGTTWTTGKNYI